MWCNIFKCMTFGGFCHSSCKLLFAFYLLTSLSLLFCVLAFGHGEHTAWLQELWNDSLVLLECQLFQADPLFLHRTDSYLSWLCISSHFPVISAEVYGLLDSPLAVALENLQSVHLQIVQLSLSLEVCDQDTYFLLMFIQNQGTMSLIYRKLHSQVLYCHE